MKMFMLWEIHLVEFNFINAFKRDEKRKMPKALVLISPFLDMEAIVDSRIRNKNNDLLIGGGI